jgi:hypothetical protein
MLSNLFVYCMLTISTCVNSKLFFKIFFFNLVCLSIVNYTILLNSSIYKFYISSYDGKYLQGEAKSLCYMLIIGMGFSG